jgi:hypothetical protein
LVQAGDSLVKSSFSDEENGQLRIYWRGCFR